MCLLQSHKHFKSADIDEFQQLADEFCEIYVDLTGQSGMTNYIHCLHSGHFLYFLRKYGNLYLVCQQGWENINSRVKCLFYFNTQKGGGVRGSIKLGPVMRTMARGMLWRYVF